VLVIEVRYYDGGHRFFRGYNEHGMVAAAIVCCDLAEAVVLAGDSVRRGNGETTNLFTKPSA
jgi:hypothetical protein